MRLLKHIVRCYLRLSEHTRARDALRQCLPEALRDQTFANTIRGEESVQKWLSLLQKNLSERPAASAAGGASPGEESAATGATAAAAAVAVGASAGKSDSYSFPAAAGVAATVTGSVNWSAT